MCKCIGILSLDREDERFCHFLDLAEIIAFGRSCHVELECIPRCAFLGRKRDSVVNLRKLVFACEDIISVHEHAAVVLLLKLSDLHGIEKVEGVLRNGFDIEVQIVVDNELTEIP